MGMKASEQYSASEKNNEQAEIKRANNWTGRLFMTIS